MDAKKIEEILKKHTAYDECGKLEKIEPAENADPSIK